MRIGFKHLVVLALLLATGGFAFAWSGLFNVAASSGHWAVTDWFLHWTMRNSVKTHALGIEVPPLDDEAMAERGAGHFAAGCAPCHGAPGEPRPAVVREMTPEPPALAEQIGEWNPNELFWIVRHGVKYTGMPAWPADQREDEIWSVVAFLLRLPSLDADSYAALAFGEAGPSKEKATGGISRFETLLDGCARCHGEDGRGRTPGAFPDLAGQSEDYLAASLAAYAERHRASGVMQLAASGLERSDIETLANHYAEQSSSSLSAENRSGSMENRSESGEESGAELVANGDPKNGVPACKSCHGGVERYPAYPKLNGLDAGYLATQLNLFKQGERGGTAYSHIMTAIAGRLSSDQIERVSAYYATNAELSGL